MDSCGEALVVLGRHLKAIDYCFTAITPLSHRYVTARTPGSGRALTDVFGWSRTFHKSDLPPAIVALLEDARELEAHDNLFRSKVRFATLGHQLYVHSSYPTVDEDAVFFGPDTYRFARLIRQSIWTDRPAGKLRIIDLGCGSGAGGLYAGSLFPDDNVEVTLVDVNEKALRYSQVNIAINSEPVAVTTLKSDLFSDVDGTADLIISNPPYLVDQAARQYRHGGDRGFDLSLRIVEESLDRLAAGGRLILYTGTPIVAGIDQFLQALSQMLAARNRSYCYEEIDPDVFGEELQSESYRDADRIAVVAVIVDAVQ
jgi:methylase of polypeptide subunit release factors